MSSNSSSLTSTGAKAPAPRVWLRVALLVIAGFETLLGVSEFSGAFDLHDAPLSLGQFVINAKLAVHPFFATAALVLAAAGRVRGAIIVLAAYILAAWPAGVETIPKFGLEWDFSPVGLSIFAEQAIFPPLAIAAIVLAYRDRHLGLATVFVGLPPANLLLGIIAFTIAIMIYGF